MKRIAIALVIATSPAHAGDAEDVAKLVDLQVQKIGDEHETFVADAPVFTTYTVREASLAGVAYAFAKLVTDGLDDTAAARKDLVAIGSARGERTNGGAVHAKAWAAWKKRATVTASRAEVAPSGTTGWAAATVELDKGGYKMPFFVFCILEKTPSGAWSVVHSHFAVQ